MSEGPNNFPVKYEPPADRSAIQELMEEPIEGLLAHRAARPCSYRSGQRPIELHTDPRNTAGKLREQLKTPEGNREIVEEVINTFITEHLALDRYYQSEILNMELDGRGSLHNLQDVFDRKRPNEQCIIGLFSAKKRLLSQLGMKFTQVNLTKGPLQVNNNANGNEKIDSEVS